VTQEDTEGADASLTMLPQHKARLHAGKKLVMGMYVAVGIDDHSLACRCAVQVRN